MIDNSRKHAKIITDVFTIPFVFCESLLYEEARTYATKIMHKKIKTDENLFGLEETRKFQRDIYCKVLAKIHKKLANKYNQGEDFCSKFDVNFGGVNIPLMSEFMTDAAMSQRGLDIVEKINEADGFKNYSIHRSYGDREDCIVGQKFISAIYAEQNSNALIYKAFVEVVSEIYQEMFPEFASLSEEERHNEKAGYFPQLIRFFPTGVFECSGPFVDEDGEWQHLFGAPCDVGVWEKCFLNK